MVYRVAHNWGESVGIGNLKLLALEGNQLTGGIPATLGDLDKLWNLSLNDNPLGGAIPATLATM